MNILLDECVPQPLRKILLGHSCQSAQECGWGGVANGALLSLAEERFELFITSDQNMLYQQNIKDRKIAILMLSTNNWRAIQAASAMILEAVNTIQPAEFRFLDIPLS